MMTILKVLFSLLTIISIIHGKAFLVKTPRANMDPIPLKNVKRQFDENNQIISFVQNLTTVGDEVTTTFSLPVSTPSLGVYIYDEKSDSFTIDVNYNMTQKNDDKQLLKDRHLIENVGATSISYIDPCEMGLDTPVGTEYEFTSKLLQGGGTKLTIEMDFSQSDLTNEDTVMEYVKGAQKTFFTTVPNTGKLYNLTLDIFPNPFRTLYIGEGFCPDFFNFTFADNFTYPGAPYVRSVLGAQAGDWFFTLNPQGGSTSRTENFTLSLLVEVYTPPATGDDDRGGLSPVNGGGRNRGLSGGEVAGIVVACFVAAVGAGVAAFFVFRWYRRRQSEESVSFLY